MDSIAELLKPLFYFNNLMADVNKCQCTEIRTEILEKFSEANNLAEKSYVKFAEKLMKYAGYLLNYGIKNNNSEVKKLAGRFLNAGIKLKKKAMIYQFLEECTLNG